MYFSSSNFKTWLRACIRHDLKVDHLSKSFASRWCLLCQSQKIFDGLAEVSFCSPVYFRYKHAIAQALCPNSMAASTLLAITLLGGGVFLQPCIFQIQACYRTSTLSEFYGGLYTARNYSKHTGKFLPRESLLQKHKRISVSHRMRQRRKLQKLSTYFEKRAGKA